MARSVNKAILVGNLGRDPEMRHTGSGRAVTTFTVATNYTRRGDSGSVEETEWHNVVTWGKLAEICDQYLEKGRKVYIEGRIQTRSWDDEKTGMKRYMTEIHANEMVILDSRGGGGRSFAAEPRPQSHPEPDFDMPDSDDFDDDLPF